MTRFALVILAAALTGCKPGKALSNDEILRETKTCRESNLYPATWNNFLGEITEVQCEPRQP